MAVQDDLVENADCLVVTCVCLCLALMMRYHCFEKIALSKCRTEMERERRRGRQRETCKELLSPFASRAVCTGLCEVLESGPPERY